jgi:hypothetical protein
MSARTITLLAAVLSTIGTALLAIKDVVSPEWALLIAAVGAGLYGVVRALQKIAAGATLKSLVSTTEAWGAGLVIVAAIVTAAARVVPPSYAGTAAGIAAVLITVARVLQSTRTGGLPPGPPATT